MKIRGSAFPLTVVGFVLFLIVFAYLELTYTRRVDGTSMLPTLEEGDLVVVQSVPFNSLRVGDVIVYNPPCSATGASVIHRVVAESGGGLITKGDNNPYTDPAGSISTGPITSSCLVGKVVYVVPYIERVASLPYGTNYLLVLLIFIAVIYAELRGKETHSTDDGGAPTSTGRSLLEAGQKNDHQGDGTEPGLGLYTLYILKEIGRRKCLKPRPS